MHSPAHLITEAWIEGVSKTRTHKGSMAWRITSPLPCKTSYHELGADLRMPESSDRSLQCFRSKFFPLTNRPWGKCAPVIKYVTPGRGEVWHSSAVFPWLRTFPTIELVTSRLWERWGKSEVATTTRTVWRDSIQSMLIGRNTSPSTPCNGSMGWRCY